MPCLYVDYMSQPSRACLLFVKLNKLPVDIATVLIHKGETRSKDHLARNPFGKVPSLVDGEFNLPESAAILTYLATKYSTPENWYPRSCLQARALVDSGLHWYHSNIRAGCAKLMFNKVIAQRLGMVGNEEVARDALGVLQLSLKALEGGWLKKGAQPFMTGSQVSLPDLLCCCELEQLCMLNKAKHGTDMEEILARFPGVRQWMSRVADACGPVYGEVHAVLRRAAAATAGASTPPASSKL